MPTNIKPKTLLSVVAAAFAAGCVVLRFFGLADKKEDLLSGFEYALDHFADLSAAGMPIVKVTTLGCEAALVGVVLIFMQYIRWATKGTFRRGEEHGSARWATKEEIQAFGDPKIPINNIILSKDARIRYTKNPNFLYQRTRNVLVVGGSGSGKTEGYVKPNLMQVLAPETGLEDGKPLDESGQSKYTRSFFITDPKGVTCNETGHLFAEHGYEIKVFNTIDFDCSLCYNPMKYIRSEEDVLSFATCLIKNTTPPDAGKAGDPFWEKSETLVYQAIVNYMLTEIAPEDRNLPTMCDLLDLGQIDEESGLMCGLDILFAELETGKEFDPTVDDSDVPVSRKEAARRGGGSTRRNPWVQVREPQPNHPGVVAYNSFKVGAKDTKRSILISVKVRLAALRTKHIRRLLERDEMELDLFGDKKMVCYAVVSAIDKTYYFLFAILIWQMFKELTCRGTMRYGHKGGALPVGVEMLLDEFGNYFIPNFQTTISVIRSYNISAHLILQSYSQLKERYGEEGETTIIDNCDSTVFMGGNSDETNEKISKKVGKQTVTTDNVSNSHAEKSSWSQSVAQHARDLMTPDEVGRLDGDKSIVLIRGAHPYKGLKFNVKDHPLYDWINPGEGRRFADPFDYGAYRHSPAYYKEDDTRLEILTSSKLLITSPTNPANVKHPHKQAYTVLIQSHVSDKGSDVAYNVKGAAELQVCCESNLDGERFPSMEPFGTTRGLRFLRTGVFSNKGSVDYRGDYSDCVEWLESGNYYDIHGTDIEPGATTIFSFTMAVPVEDVLSKMRRDLGEGGTGSCLFRFDFLILLQSANGGRLSDKHTVRLEVKETGVARLVGGR